MKRPNQIPFRGARLAALLAAIALALPSASRAAKTPAPQGSAPAAASTANNRDNDLKAKVERVLRGDLAGLDTMALLGDVETALARKQAGEAAREKLNEAAGVLHFSLGQFDGSRRFLSKLKRPSPMAERMLALSLYELGEYRKSLAYFPKVRGIRESKADWEKFCTALSQAGAKAEALKEWEGYHAKYPGSEAGLDFMAQGYRKPLVKEKLIPVLEAVLKKSRGGPDEGPLLAELAGLYGDSHVKAVELRQQYLKLHPEDPSAGRDLAVAYEARGEWKKAQEAFLQVAAQFPTDLKFNRHLAGLLAKCDKEKAVVYYEICRTLAPKDLEIALEMAHVLDALKRPDQALEAYQAVLELNPAHPEAKARMLALAESRPDPRWLTAMAENERKNPRDHAFQFQLARQYLAAKDKENAYKYLQKALQNNPGSAEYANLLPLVITSEAQILKHFPLLQKMGQGEGPSARLLVLLGRGYSIYKNPQRAAEAYTRVMAMDPGLLEGKRQPILDFYAVKDYTTAAKLADAYLKDKDKDVDIREIQVASLDAIKAPGPRMRAALQGLMALETYNDKWYFKLAQLDLAAKDTAAALQHGREWTRIHPEDKDGNLFLEPLAARSKDGELYLATLDNLARLEPAKAAQHELMMAYYLMDAGNFGQAVEAMGKLVSAFPADAKFWNRYGVCQAKLGRDGAMEALAKAYHIEPANFDYARAFAASLNTEAEVKANLDVFQSLRRQSGAKAIDKRERRKLARSLYLNGSYGQAAQEWDWVLANDPAAAVEDSTAALSYLKVGQSAKAKPLLEKRLAQTPRDVGLLATLSDVYGREGDSKRKVSMMERLVQEDQSHGDYVLRLAREKEKAGSPEALSFYSQWAFRHQDDAATLKSYLALAEKQKDTASLIEALRYITRLKDVETAYKFHLAELYFARSGEIKDIEDLVKEHPEYTPGKLILVQEYLHKGLWEKLAGFEAFLTAESANRADLLEPLADLYARRDKVAQAHQAYFNWLSVKKKDRDVFDKVYDYAKEKKSPYLTAILKLGCESFPQDVSLKTDYAAALGKTRSALDAYQDVLAKKPKDAEAAQQATEIARGLGDRAATIKWAKRWSELQPDERKPLKYLMESLSPSSDKAALAEVMESMLRLEPGDLDLVLRLARLEEELGRWDKAIGLYHNALYLSPKDRSLRERLIGLMKSKSKKEDLADVLTEIQNIDTSAHEAQFELAKLYLQKGNKIKAYTYLSTALEQSPLNHVYQALVPKVIGNQQQTLKHFKLLQEIAKRPETSRSNPDNADLFLLLGRGYAAQNEWDASCNNYSVAYRLAPKALWGDRDAVIAVFRGKNYELAGTLTEKFFESHVDFDKDLRQIQVLCYEKMNRDPSLIRKTLQVMLTFDRENGGALIRLAELDLRAGDTAAAISNIRNCLMTSPNEMRGYKMLLPLVAGRANQQMSYVSVLERLAALDSANRASYDLKLADFYFNRKNYRETARLMNEIVEARPKDPSAWYRLGQCRNHLGVGDLGISCFAKANQLEPNNLVYAHTFAQTLQTPEEFKTHLSLYRMVADHGPSLHERKGLAMAHFYNNEMPGAAQAWDKYLAEATDNRAFIPEAGLAYIRTSQPAKALPLYVFRREHEGGNLGYLDTLCFLYTKTGDGAGRMSVLEALVGVDPTYKDFQLQLAVAKEKARDTVEAISQYGQWTARNNGDGEALKSMHRLAQGKRDTASLENALRLIVKIKGMDPEYSFQLAELQFKFSGDPANLERLVKAYPQYHRGRVILAKEYFRRYDIPKMIPFEKDLALEAEKDRDLLGALAELYAYQDKKGPAHKAFRDNLVWRKSVAARAGSAGPAAAAAALDFRQAFDKGWLYADANQSPFLVEILDIGNASFPGESPIQHALAAALGKDPRALDLWKQILAKDPDDLAALKGASELAMASGKSRDAVPWLERWTALDGGAIRPWQLLTDAYGAQGEKAKVAEALDRQTLLSPTDAALTFKTAQAYDRAGNREKGLEFMIRADELKPKDPAYAAALMDLLRSMTEELLAKGQAARAVELYGLMLERDPKQKKANLYMGMWLAENKDFGASENMLKLGLDQSAEPKSVQAKGWRLMGDCLAASGKGKPSLEAYKRALVLDPEDKAAAVARLDLTRALGIAGELPPALADVVRLDSANLDAVAALAEIRLKEGNFPVASSLYRRVALARDTDKDAWMHYGEALEGSKRNDDAMAAWQKAFALGDRTPYMLQGLARLHHDKGTLGGAQDVLEELVAAQPENDEACAWLGFQAMEQGKFDKAEEMLFQASQSAPDKIEYTQGIGEVFLRRGDLESAQELLEPKRALLTAPGRLTLADVLRSLGKPDPAQPLYEEVMQKQPSARALAGLADVYIDKHKPLDAKRVIEASTLQADPEVRLRLANAMLALREKDKAASLLTALVKDNRENPAYWYALGMVHYEQKNNSQALKEFRQALAKQPNHAGAAYHAGAIQLATGQVVEARALFFNLAQSVNRSDRAMGLRGLGEAALAEKKDAEALDYLVQSGEVHGEPELLAEVSQLYLKQGKLPEAEDWAQRSLEADEDYPDGIVALAEVMMAQGHKDEARDFLKESLTRNPRACDLHIEYAKVNLALENFSGIASNSRQVLTLCPDEPLSYYYAGVVADRSYQKKEAQEYFKYYKKLGGDAAVIPKGY